MRGSPTSSTARWPSTRPSAGRKHADAGGAASGQRPRLPSLTGAGRCGALLRSRNGVQRGDLGGDGWPAHRGTGGGSRRPEQPKLGRLLWTAAAALSLVGCAIAFEVGIGANSAKPRLSSAFGNVVSSATPSLPRATMTKSTATETAPARPTTNSHAGTATGERTGPKPAPVVPAPAAVTTDSKASASSGADTHPRPAIDPARLMSDDVLDRRD